MKKIVVCAFMFLAAASVSFLAGCSDDKVISSEAMVDETRTATLEFRVKYLSAVTSDGNTYQDVPSARMILTASNEKLGAEGAKGNFVKDVALAGQFSVQLPVTSEGVTYTAAFTDFVASYKAGTEDAKDYIYKVTEASVTGDLSNLKPGEYRIIKVEYKPSAPIAF
jgi:lipoprotein